jgi:hypothetical protein
VIDDAMQRKTETKRLQVKAAQRTDPVVWVWLLVALMALLPLHSAFA